MGTLVFRHAPEDMLSDLAMREKGLHRFVEELAGQIPIFTLGKGDGEVMVVSTTSTQSPPDKSSITGFTTRMHNRRKRDKDDDDRRKRPPRSDYDIVFGMRPRSMMAYAIDVTTWQVYVGYSGGASPVFGRRLPIESRQHRLDRVGPYLGEVQQRTEFDPLNCAEVAALNVALSYGAQIGNLFFISMDSQGRLRNPCDNCIQWITRYAFGYLRV